MTNKILILLSFFAVTIPGFAQNLHLIDSIKQQLRNAQSVRRFELLNDLAWEYRWAYPDSTVHYAKQANTLGQSLNLSKGMAKPINFKKRSRLVKNWKKLPR